jgi:hypothetical protein
MFRMTRVAAALVLFSVAAVSHAADRLKNYPDLYKALTNGREVRVVLNYLKMDLIIDGKKEPKSVDAVGGMQIGSWERFAKGVVRNDQEYIATSATNLIAHPRYGHVYNYVRLRIYLDGTVEVTARYLTPTDYKVVMDETFKGSISNGKDENAVSFFATSK